MTVKWIERAAENCASLVDELIREMMDLAREGKYITGLSTDDYDNLKLDVYAEILEQFVKEQELDNLKDAAAQQAGAPEVEA